MQFYQKRTVAEQANRLPQELREAYKKSQIDRITLFDGEEELELTGYAEYSYLEEKSYKTQPVRTQEGSIEEIEEYATFSTPRLIIKYNMMGIEDYRSLMKMLNKQNGFIVKCYDVVEDKIVKKEVYHAPPSMPIIYQQYLNAMGIREYSIEFIGTNTFTKINFELAYETFETFFGTTWKDLAEKDPSHFVIIDSKVCYIPVGSSRYYYVCYGDTYKYVSQEDFIIKNGVYGAI